MIVAVSCMMANENILVWFRYINETFDPLFTSRVDGYESIFRLGSAELKVQCGKRFRISVPIEYRSLDVSFLAPNDSASLFAAI